MFVMNDKGAYDAKMGWFKALMKSYNVSTYLMGNPLAKGSLCMIIFFPQLVIGYRFPFSSFWLKIWYPFG